MRRVALLGLLTLLAGCGDSSFGDFLGNTVSFKANPNSPMGEVENMRRVRAMPVEAAPIESDSGDVWPGPLPPPKTLSDIARMVEMPVMTPAPAARGSSTPPAPVAPALAPTPTASVPRPATVAAPASPPAVVQTPDGAAVRAGGSPNLPNYAGPSGAGGVLINNGNGTSTLIAPDGRISTVPTPKQ